jgi:hypothetical protein
MGYSNLLVQRCDIYRKTDDKADSRGYTTPVDYGTTPLYSSVPCRGQNLFESSAGLRILTGGVSAENDYLFFFKRTQDIQKGDKIVWQGLELFVKPIQQVYDRKKIHHKEVYCGLSET